MKRVLSLLLVLCLAVALVPLSASAEGSGVCGENARWQLQDGILIISGTGDMDDYTLESLAPWAGERTRISWAIIGEGITRIGDYAFYNCQQLSSVQMAASVSAIGTNAFYNCSGLTSIDLPAGLRTMGTAAFSRCTGLTEISRWGELTAIPRFAFNECTSLKKLPDLTESITVIDDSAFHHCVALTYLVLPKFLTTIGEDAFRASGLTALTLPSSVTKVGNYAFAECDDLKAIILPRALLESAGRYTFALCDAQLIPVGDPGNTQPGPGPTPSDTMKILYTRDLEDGQFLTVSENTVRRELALFAADGSVIAAVSIPFVPEDANPYPDVPNASWYAPYVKYVTTAGLFGGDETGAFLPYGSMTRAMLVTVLYRLAGSPSGAGTDTPFEDVRSTSWYAAAVAWANKTGIVTGVDETHFSPNTNVSRQQIVAMLHRFALMIQRDSGARANLIRFADSNDVALYALDDMSWAVAVQIMEGSDNRLRPEDPATRAEAATLLTKFLALLRADD